MKTKGFFAKVSPGYSFQGDKCRIDLCLRVTLVDGVVRAAPCTLHSSLGASSGRLVPVQRSRAAVSLGRLSDASDWAETRHWESVPPLLCLLACHLPHTSPQNQKCLPGGFSPLMTLQAPSEETGQLEGFEL